MLCDAIKNMKAENLPPMRGSKSSKSLVLKLRRLLRRVRGTEKHDFVALLALATHARMHARTVVLLSKERKGRARVLYATVLSKQETYDESLELLL